MREPAPLQGLHAAVPPLPPSTRSPCFPQPHSHVLEVLAAAQPSARVVVVEALGRVVSGALARIPAAAAAPGGEAPAAAGAPPAPGPPSGLEHMLLVSLESVYGGEREPEVRRAVLRVLLSTLQRHGERLGGGWGAVFRLLAAVPEARDAAATDLGFQAVQLVAGDFAAGLGAARLRRCLEVAAVYGAQQVQGPQRGWVCVACVGEK